MSTLFSIFISIQAHLGKGLSIVCCVQQSFDCRTAK